jgi:predicted O-methyltransferase YrrM
MNIDHLPWPQTGWGYSPPTEDLLDIFRFVRDHINPKMILEIGFRYGHSATYQLELMPDASVVSFDPAEGITKYEYNMDLIYGGRFELHNTEGYNACKMFDPGYFDFAYIDGSHNYEMVKADIKSCLELDIPWLLFDNVEHPEVRRAIEESSVYFYKKLCYNNTFKGKTSNLEMMLCTA